MAWDREEDYAYLNKASREQFAWEFIRRTDEYKKVWKSAYSELKKAGKLPEMHQEKFEATDPRYGLNPHDTKCPDKNIWQLVAYFHPDVQNPAIEYKFRPMPHHFNRPNLAYTSLIWNT